MFSQRLAWNWRIARLKKLARTKLVRLDQNGILTAVRSFGLFKSNILFVHTSLSACGHIEGGPKTVVDAFRAWIPERAMLAMPTHTWSYPDETGLAPVYDARTTPSVVGAITNYFWQQPGIVRSLHPSHSLACSGPGSEGFCQGHELCETPCGTGTPYQRLVQQEASVLMFGATLDAYTLFHTAEDIAQTPYLYMQKQLTLRTKEKDGTIRKIPTRRQDMGVTRRFGDMDTWLEQQGLLMRRKLGFGELLFIPSAAALHERIVAELRHDPLLLVAESARPEVASRHNLALSL
jgi:aminoglycoside 3-N-acetyltransferase